MKTLNNFEEEIKGTYHLPTPNPAFLSHLEKEFADHPAANQATTVKPPLRVAKVWGYAAITLILLLTLLFAIGPTKVLAQIQAIFGYVPDVGVVDTSAAFYQLEKPVSDTKDGVTLIIDTAFQSADQTVINFTIPDWPESIHHAAFGEPACNQPAYLLLADGSQIQHAGYNVELQPDGTYDHTLRFAYSEVPEFEKATLVFPCLEFSAQGMGPKDWAFGLAFVPAPEDVASYPVTLMDRTEPAEIEDVQIPTQPADMDVNNAMPAMIVDGDRQEEMTVLGVAEKADSYWVTWAYPMQHDWDIQVNGFLLMMPFNAVLYDANGNEQPPADLELQNELWDYQVSLLDQFPDEDRSNYAGVTRTFAIPKTGFAFPVYLKLNVLERSFPEKELYAEIQFDGTAVQSSDDPVLVNQKVQIGDIAFELVSIEKGEYGGYTFNFDGAQGEVIDCRVELVGHPTDTSGQSSLVADDPFHFHQSLIYFSPPRGDLTVRIDLPAVLGDMISLIGTWSPDN